MNEIFEQKRVIALPRALRANLLEMVDALEAQRASLLAAAECFAEAIRKLRQVLEPHDPA